MNSRKDTTRKLNIETLAKREVFAANVLASMALPVEKIETMIPAWHNVDMPSDVNRDGAITPMDALFRINSLNQDGARKLPASKPASAPFYDANGDDWLSPVDAIAVINELNKTPLTETVKQGRADVAEKVDQHNAKPNPGFTIAAESLAKINSIKPIHADKGTDDTEAEDQKLIEEMGWTKADLKTEAAIREMGWDVDGPKANAFREDVEANGYEDAEDKLHNRISLDAIAETLGLSEEKTREIRKRFEQRSKFDRVSTSEQNDVKLDAVAAFLNVSVDDMRDKGISPEQGLLIAASIQEGGLEKTPEDYIKSKRSFNEVMSALAKDTATRGGLDEDHILKNSDSFKQDAAGNYIFCLDETNKPNSNGDALDDLEHAGGNKGVSAGAAGDGALNTTSDTSGMQGLSGYATGSDGPTNDGSYASGEGGYSDNSGNSSPSNSSKGNSGDDFSSNSGDDQLGQPDDTGSENQNHSGEPESKSETPTDGGSGTTPKTAGTENNGGGITNSNQNSNGTSGKLDDYSTVSWNESEITWAKANSDGSGEYVVSNTGGNDLLVEVGKNGSYKAYDIDDRVVAEGNDHVPMTHEAAPKEGTVIKHPEGSSAGDLWEIRIEEKDNSVTPGITGNCDGMNPWTNGKRKAPERITQNPGDIDPINPNFVDAVMSAEGWAQERWASEGLGKTAPHNAPSATPNDNPNSEADGHTCPESGEG